MRQESRSRAAPPPPPPWPPVTAVDLAAHREKYDALVSTAGDDPVKGLSARSIVPVMTALANGLSNDVLKDVWDLADADKDGGLTFREYVVAMYLTERAAGGVAPPRALGELPPGTFAALEVGEASTRGEEAAEPVAAAPEPAAAAPRGGGARSTGAGTRARAGTRAGAGFSAVVAKVRQRAPAAGDRPRERPRAGRADDIARVRARARRRVRRRRAPRRAPPRRRRRRRPKAKTRTPPTRETPLGRRSSSTPPPPSRAPSPSPPPWPALTATDAATHARAFESLARQSGDFADSEPVAADAVVNAGRVVPLLVAAQLPNETLKTIWDLADADVDGALTLREFTVAMYLTERAASGTAPPDKLSDVPRATFAVLGDAGADAAAKAATAVAKEEEEKNRDAMFGSLMEPVVFSPTPVAAAAAAAAEEPRREPPRAAETSSSSREDAEPSTAPPPRFASPTLRLRTPATVDLSARKSRASEGGSAGGGRGKETCGGEETRPAVPDARDEARLAVAALPRPEPDRPERAPRRERGEDARRGGVGDQSAEGVDARERGDDGARAAVGGVGGAPSSHWSPYDRVGVVNADP